MLMTLVAAKDKEEIKAVKAQLNKKFEMKRLGSCKEDSKIHRDRDKRANFT